MTKNTKTLLAVFLVVVGMGALAFASVPLYRMFCQVTGYGGTTQVSADLPDKVLKREITIKFNADIDPALPWSFKPEERERVVKIGQQGLTSFVAQNKDKAPTTGTALYNVTPPKAGKYFHKIQCFCFDEQTLTPGQEMHMPVVFYIDPALDEDESMRDVKTITLSYTFFPAESKELDKGLEDFYNQ